MSVKPWRATCIQMDSKIASNTKTREEAWQIIEENLGEAIRLIEAACTGAEPPKLVVLPEFVFQGPPRATPVSEWIERACTTIPGPITERLAEVARKYDIYIAGNHFEVDPRWPDRYFNSSFLLDPKGEIILRYRRINTASWTSPHDILSQYREAYGEDGIFPVVDTELGRLAIFPCGEVAVPELSRVFMMRGAEVLLHPSNEPANARADAAKICRAAENMCYLISTNVSGQIGFSDAERGGHSQIVDFNGNYVAFEKSDAESLSATAVIDIAALQAARRDTNMGNALLRTRWEMYRDYFANAQAYPADALDKKAFETYSELSSVQEKALSNLTAARIIREIEA
ncbi:nitrilase-related carbon-nitrogen hydrolase [Rhizobium sp. S152]|uniref:nitrilase-related carbon-nitrogen hydrolase n=1 Tax=Rhizobium sp. S152 TaxID=3055038 RepID=UPI0025A98190|nr:nitrilase-related carbon-nitrogen hydrolase [Rhizobium sp. S152]MDM9627500.1 nitrilase-related carbon-nitrogen hydrolase [Rhizobium sp. S152]